MLHVNHEGRLFMFVICPSCRALYGLVGRCVCVRAFVCVRAWRETGWLTFLRRVQVSACWEIWLTDWVILFPPPCLKCRAHRFGDSHTRRVGKQCANVFICFLQCNYPAVILSLESGLHRKKKAGKWIGFETYWFIGILYFLKWFLQMHFCLLKH